MPRHLLCLVLFSLLTVPAAARQPASDSAQPDRTAGRIRELQVEADRLAAEGRTLLAELRALEIERALRVQAFRESAATVALLDRGLAAAQARLADLEARRQAAAPGVTAQLVEIYKRGRGGYLRLLLAADDLRAAGRTTRGVMALAHLDRVRLDAHRDTLRAERDAIAELEARRAAARTAQTEAARARAALDHAVAAHEQRIAELDTRRDLAAAYAGELQNAAAALARRVDTLPSGPASPLPLTARRGGLEWPVSGRVVSAFGRSAAGDRNGIEIAVAAGQDVRAVGRGTISFAGAFLGYGTLVIVDHGSNAFTLYGHLAEASVVEGATIEQGAVVGRTGRTPDGAERTYFELRIDGRPVDPVEWLRSAR